MALGRRPWVRFEICVVLKPHFDSYANFSHAFRWGEGRRWKAETYNYSFPVVINTSKRAAHEPRVARPRVDRYGHGGVAHRYVGYVVHVLRVVQSRVSLVVGRLASGEANGACPSSRGLGGCVGCCCSFHAAKGDVVLGFGVQVNVAGGFGGGDICLENRSGSGER